MAQCQFVRETLASGLKQASAVLQWSQGVPAALEPARAQQRFRGHERAGSPRSRFARTPVAEGHSPVATARRSPTTSPRVEKPQEVLLRELTRAAEGPADRRGAVRADREVTAILNDPVGRRALDRLLIDAQTVHDNPELLKSFAAYITPDGHRARIDLTQADRIFSHDAMDQVLTLRRRLNDFLGEYQGIHVTARVAGANAESADIRALTAADQVQSWFIVPIGVFLVLIVALRDPLACFNLVATMVLTYAFALGATHLVFVTILGAEGLDWKVPYFLFVLLVAVGVDYNVFLMTRLNEESQRRGLRDGIVRAIGQTGGLITLGRGDHGEQLRVVPVQPAGLAPPARLRAGGGHPGRRRARPAASGPLRPLAAPAHPRSACAPHASSARAARVRCRAGLKP